MSASDLSQILPPIASALAVSALYAAARRGRPEIDESVERQTHRHVAALRVLGAGSAFVVPTAIAVLVLFWPPREGEAFIPWLIAGFFVALGLPLYWEGSRFAVTVSPDGLDCRSPWHRSRVLRWSEVRDVTWSDTMQWYTVRANDGWTFRVPGMAKAAREFATACDEHLARIRATEGRGVFRETSRGR